MAKTQKVSTTSNMVKASVRTAMIADGGYDGRFQNKTFKDRKKEDNKRSARNWKKELKAFCY